MPHDRGKFSQANLTVCKRFNLALRRSKANARERCRMHGLNVALEHLRRSVPIDQSLCKSCTSGQPKLSKIDTLRLAKNYILVLSTILCEDQPMGVERLWMQLSSGLSQATASLLTISLKKELNQTFSHYLQGPVKHNEGTPMDIVAKEMFATATNQFSTSKKSISPIEEQQLHPGAWSQCDDPSPVKGLNVLIYKGSITNKN